MNIPEQILQYITGLPDTKQSDILELHNIILTILPETRLLFDNGKNRDNKTVANPIIGYGFQTIKYADGKTRDFFQIGISANNTGISVYILGFKDKTYIASTYGKEIGKATVTGCCIKFKKLKDINIDILSNAIKYGVQATSET
ncbi:DUF1801 domain-containing protein [Pedobacter borealis]|uniref:DUF1801 domain-containing protein n=1 Tax=Pedobacter borealis TaxID=475254 RepID=UPI0004931D53|nr:DUF1801 domain-containing protein [Pedobacter borealis]